MFTSSYLSKKGYSKQQLQNYLKSGWLERMGVGAYKKSHDQVEWSAGLLAIQNQLSLPIYVGGKSALGFLGKGQYLQLGKMSLSLYGPSKSYLPAWFKKYSWAAKITYQQSNLFKESREDYGSKDLGYTSKEVSKHEIVMSAAERAILEYLDTLPNQGTYQEALELMENLTSLRPFVMQKLLETCKSVKVNHHWFNKLQVEKVNLGKGKRVVFKSGRFDSKYQITVPVDANEE